MRLKFYSRSIAAVMTALLVLAGCESDKSEPGTTPPPSPGELTLSVTSITDNSAIVNVKASNAEGTYYANIVSKAQYDALGSDEALIAKELENFKKLASDGGKSLEAYLSSVLQKGDKSKNVALDAPDADYYAYVYGLGADGKATTKVVKKDFKSEAVAVDADFVVAVSDIFGTKATVSVVPKDAAALYFFNIMSEAEYADFGGTKECIAAYMVDYVDYMCKQYDITPEELIEDLGSTGEDSFGYEGLDPVTDYIAFAVKIDAKGVVAGEAVLKTFATGEIEPSKMTFDIKVDEIASTSAHIVVTPSVDDETFLCDVLKVSSYSGMSDDEIISDLVTAYGDWISLLLSEGVYEYKAENFEGDYGLLPDTEYYVVAFGYEGGPTTKLTKFKFKTGKEVVDENVTFQFEVSGKSSNKMTAEVTPSNADVLYMWDIFTETDFNTLNKDVKACLQDLYTYYATQNPQYTPAVVASNLGVRGVNSYDYNLSPLTNYYVWAICVSSDGTIVGEGASKMFTTPELIVSKAAITISYSKYYDGDALNAADPVTFPASVKGLAYVPTTITPNADAAHWYSALFKGNYVDPAVVSDAAVIANVKQANADKSAVNFMATWDTQVTFFGYAVDKDGNTGVAARVGAKFVKSGASPVSDLIGAKVKAKMPYANSMMLSKSIVNLLNREKSVGQRSVKMKVVAAPAKQAKVVKSGTMNTRKMLDTKASVVAKKQGMELKKYQRR